MKDEFEIEAKALGYLFLFMLSIVVIYFLGFITLFALLAIFPIELFLKYMHDKKSIEYRREHPI